MCTISATVNATRTASKKVTKVDRYMLQKNMLCLRGTTFNETCCVSKNITWHNNGTVSDVEYEREEVRLKMYFRRHMHIYASMGTVLLRPQLHAQGANEN